MHIQNTAPGLQHAAARAATKLGAASTRLLEMHDEASEEGDRDRLYEMAFEAFWAAGYAWSLSSHQGQADASTHASDDPLSLLTMAHEILAAHATVADAPGVRSLVLDIGTVLQRLRHYVERR